MIEFISGIVVGLSLMYVAQIPKAKNDLRVIKGNEKNNIYTIITNLKSSTAINVAQQELMLREIGIVIPARDLTMDEEMRQTKIYSVNDKLVPRSRKEQ